MKINPLRELSKNYAELVTLAYTTKINIFDENRDNPKAKLFYIDILIPGMVVYHYGQQWTLSKQVGEPIFHSVWTNTEGETKSAYRFLNDVIEGQYWPVEIIFNPARFTSKCY